MQLLYFQLDYHTKELPQPVQKVPSGIVKVHPRFSDPPGRWTTWEEYLQLKPGGFTPDQIVAVITHNQLKIGRTMARILKMVNWFSTLRLVAVVGHFKCQVGADNPGERWR